MNHVLNVVGSGRANTNWSAISIGRVCHWSNRMVDEARKILSMESNHEDACPAFAPQSELGIAAAIRSASCRDPTGPSSETDRKTWDAANQRDSCGLDGCVSYEVTQGGKRHQPAPTLSARSRSRLRSCDRLAVRMSNHGSIRGTAHIAMVITPRIAPSLAGTTSFEAKSGGAVSDSMSSFDGVPLGSSPSEGSHWRFVLRSRPSARVLLPWQPEIQRVRRWVSDPPSKKSCPME